MSSITSYKTTAFKESQKFLVIDPSTQSPSLVLGSDLVSYITPMLNYVRADSTRISAENTDYDVGTLVQTSGATSPGDNFAATYLVVEGGSGDFPMLNGNDLLVIKGDEFLREQLVQPVATYNDVAQMVADVSLLESRKARTLGYYTPGDGGGNDYEIVAGATGTADGGSFIDLDNGLQAKGLFENGISVKQFGAVGNLIADDSAKTQAALDYAKSGQKVSANGTFLIASDISIPEAVTLKGEHEWAAQYNGNNFTNYENRIVISPSASINLQRDSGVSGLVILANGITVPANAAEVATWAGTALFVAAGVGGASIRDCFIGGFERAVDTDVTDNPQINMENVTIDCRNGVRVDLAADICYFNKVHCWPWLTVGFGGSETDEDKERDGAAFELLTIADWAKLTDCFAFGYNVGYKINGVNSVTMQGCSADNVTNNTLNPNSVGFLIEGNSAEVVLSNCQAADNAAHGFHVNTTATASNVRLTSCTGWSNGLSQIRISDGRAIVTSCVARGDGTEIGINLTSTDKCIIKNNILQNLNTGINYAGSFDVVDGDNRFFNCSSEYATRFLASVASAGTIVLEVDRDVFEVTGTTSIATINPIEGFKGQKITLIFRDSLDVLTSGNIKLNGGASYSVTADDTLTIVCDGTDWYETSRSVN